MTYPSPHDRAADAVHDGRPVEAKYVRGGGKGRRILTILLVSLSAVSALLFGVWLLSQDRLSEVEPGAAVDTANVAAFDRGTPAPGP